MESKNAYKYIQLTMVNNILVLPRHIDSISI